MDSTPNPAGAAGVVPQGFPDAALQDGDDHARLRQRLLDFLWSFLFTAACALGFVLTPVDARASQTVEVRDGDTTVLKISSQDQTRLRVENGRMLEVVGDVYDLEKNPQGRLVVLRDDEAGEFYLKPVSPPAGTPGSPGQAVQPVKLDVKTSRGTVGLLLTPVATIGHTVTLRVVGGPVRLDPVHPAARAAAHPRAIKAMVLAMASPAIDSPLAVRRLPGGGEVVSLWAEARFVLQATYQAPALAGGVDGGIEGEAYQLTNVSKDPMVLDEREFYAPGVLAVSVRRLQLAPGEATPVWIVRSASRQP